MPAHAMPIHSRDLRIDASPLEVRALPEESDPALRYVYAISMGVRRDDADLAARLDAFIERRHDAFAGGLDSTAGPCRWVRRGALGGPAGVLVLARL